MTKMSSIGKKYAMALSAFFLLIFILQHFSINFLSVLSPELFNEVSHFMGTNPIVQFGLQPVLIFGFLFHITMGVVLDIQNRSARGVAYVSSNNTAGDSWMSKNMIITGIMVMLFLGLHMYDFWWHEITVKYIQGDMSGLIDGTSKFRYHEELVTKFQGDYIRTGIYVLAFVFLGLHLAHGFQSSFQSVGARHPKYTPVIEKVGYIFSIVIPLGFTVIALVHCFNLLN